MKTIIKKWYEKLSFPPEWDAEFYSLLEKKELAPCLISEYDNSCEDKERNLLMYIFFCEELSESYAAQGIGKDVLFETLSDVVIWAKVHYEINGSLGLTQVNWLSRHFAMKLYRLGRLQFCMAEGELEIHIAEGDSLTPEKCENSISLAKAFFKKHFPDFRYDKFTCHSWLLDETLLAFVGEDSNIAKFRSMFEIRSSEEADDALKYIFRRDATRENLSMFTPTTSLAKKIYDHVQNGGKLYCTLGEIRKH